jgi:hypothetical protein
MRPVWGALKEAAAKLSFSSIKIKLQMYRLDNMEFVRKTKQIFENYGRISKYF